MATHGIHHMTAICRDAQQNVDFYVGILGMRFVKRTVNFDDPSAYHLYYGDADGSPGSTVTFFPYPDGHDGRPGRGSVVATALAVPQGSLEAWMARLAENVVEFDMPVERFGARVLALRDPDGVGIELVETEQPLGRPWHLLPSSMAITGIHGVTLSVGEAGPSEQLMTQELGFRRVAEAGNRIRFESGDGGPGRYVDLLVEPDRAPARGGPGSVHHIAFRIEDDPQQLELRRALEPIARVSPVMDRTYFHSIYFREPGGTLFEVATDRPGFSVDEPVESLGEALRLPPAYEPRRELIEKRLPELRIPQVAK